MKSKPFRTGVACSGAGWYDIGGGWR